MNEHALRLLEFETVRREIMDYAWSEDGRSRLAGEGFSRSEKELEKIRRPVAEFRVLFDTCTDRPAVFLPSIADMLKAAEKPGAVLEPAQIGTIGSYLRQAGTLKAYIKKGGGLLREEADGLPDMGALSTEIGRIIDREGNVKEDEIPSLAQLRRKIRAGRRELDVLAASYLGGADYKSYWQSDTASQKDGRMVLPLAANFRGRIKGVVHEISRGGATAFFEPLDIFEKNNAAAETENEYRRELFRILKDLTARIGACSGDLWFLVERLARIDSWQARASYGRVHSCFPAFPAAGHDRAGFALSSARHPLLGKKAVPVDIVLSGDTRVLLITGPNTGGKTLALKTAGLFALMNQFGMEIPAAGDSCLPLFDDIFVDMGDEQSIANSLSTFSAHISNLAKISEACTDSSLVLLDELGSGTDPEQGAAIAMAFLDCFLERGVRALVTTHLGTLKHYAFERAGVSNASVEFDGEAFVPVYKILAGVPGESHALEIARRCGVSPAIVAKAREYVSGSGTDSARLIRELIQKEADIARTLLAQRKILADLEEEKERLAAKEKDLAARELRLRREGLSESRRFLSESRKTLESLIHEFRAAQTGIQARPPDPPAQNLRSFTDGLQNLVSAEEQKIEELSTLARAVHTQPLREGMEVFIGDPPRRAVLERKLSGGRWQLSAGDLRLSLPESEITPPDAASGTSVPALEKKPDVSISLVQTAVSEPARLELDIRGLRAAEALAALVKQTDRAILQGLREFSVIHGKGEGILQETVHACLRAHPAVENFSFAHPNQGGTGKTLVRLK
ncbi:MAG: Smr/MutS family protein [Spirochaetales bacterium]|jgi:DNA mismatch repair protein MutS2|nr:Smr/MutS family protein [Spirochaetales bacterium]